jgi:hypothetical protein
MDFSTKAVAEISKLVVGEIGEQIRTGKVKDLQELENGMRELLKGVGQQAYGEVLEKEDSKNGRRVSCECGAQARRISKQEAKMLTVFGWVSYRRSYYGCPQCSKKQYRLDQDWDIRPGQVSPILSILLAIAGVNMAFEKAQRSIEKFLLIDVSDNTIRKQTQLMGEKQGQLEAQWIQDSQNETWLQNRERTIENVPDRLYGSMDGAQVPIGEEWRELKSLSWYRVTAVYGQDQHKAQEISYHSEIAPAQEFGYLLWATGVRRLADKAKELIFVCDGAVWIWKLVSRYFPDAVQIVDWYHACEYLTPIADAVFSQDAERQTWLQKVKDWLWNGKIKNVICSCQPYLHHRLAADAAQRAVTYYTNNQHRMDYAEYRKKGYWIGSGTVESACKQIATARLKIAGARWTFPGAIATAKARSTWLSHDNSFDTLTQMPLAA